MSQRNKHKNEENSFSMQLSEHSSISKQKKNNFETIPSKISMSYEQKADQSKELERKLIEMYMRPEKRKIQSSRELYK